MAAVNATPMIHLKPRGELDGVNLVDSKSEKSNDDEEDLRLGTGESCLRWTLGGRLLDSTFSYRNLITIFTAFTLLRN